MFTQEDKDNFSTLAESLKLFRRADLNAFIGDDAMESLYIDPFRNNFIIKSMLSPNSTILIGRKGTGKSTIILKLQHELKKNDSTLAIYLDVKTIFEQTKSLDFEDEEYSGVLDEESIKKYLLYKAFIKDVLENIKLELKGKIKSKETLLTKIVKKFKTCSVFERDIDELLSHVENDEYKDLTMLKSVNTKNVSKSAAGKEVFAKAAVDTQTSGLLSGKIGASGKSTLGEEKALEEEFSRILIKYYNPKAIMIKIKNILSSLNIKHLYICLDDYSEIDEGAIDIFVDSIIAPLNNWSEEFIKFKICAYPHRYYLGDIDSTKIDILNLDYFNMYSAANSTNSLQEAIDYTERLLDVRFKYFCNKEIKEFVDEKLKMEDFYKEIFYITANVPRSIGRILWYVNRFTVALDKKITLKDLKRASEQFYIEAISEFFKKTMHVKLSYNEKLTKQHLYNVLNLIVKRAKINKTEVGKSDAAIFANYNTNTAPTSFFSLPKNPAFEQIISSLELNYFITKYNEQKDRDGNNVNIYWINHGLCQKEDIIFGRGEDRKYITERRFNYGSIIKEYIDGQQEIECDSCHAKFEISELEMLKKYDMGCYKCKKGKCHIKELDINLPDYSSCVQLPEIEYDLLRTIFISGKELFASEIAGELDCSYQLISKRAQKLKTMEYIKTSKDNRGSGRRTYYGLTNFAKRDFNLK